MALQVINPGQGASAQLQPFQMRLPQGPTLSAGNPVVDKETGNLMAAVGAYADRQKKMRDNEDLVAAVTDLQKSAVDFQTEWKLSHFGVDARDAGSVFSGQVDATAKDILENRFKGRPELQAAFRQKAMEISLQGFTHGSSYDSQQDLAYRKQQLDGMNANYQGILATGTPAQIDAARQDIVTSMELLFPGMDHTKAISDLDKTTYMGMIQRKITDGDPAGAMAYLQAGMKGQVFGPKDVEQAWNAINGNVKSMASSMADLGDVGGVQNLRAQYDTMIGRGAASSSTELNGGIAAQADQWKGRVQYFKDNTGKSVRDPRNGRIDCSGWTGWTLEQCGIKGFRGLNAEGQIDEAWARGAGRVSEQELLANPRENMLIAIDTGPHDWDAGRPKGIDHIAVTYRDDKTGKIMVSESAGGKGVRSVTWDQWLSERGKKTVAYYGADLSTIKGQGAAKPGGKRAYSDLALNEANNNPGNISGRGGVGNGYKAYATTLEGFQALDQLIQTKYRDMTPMQLAEKYAPANDPRGKNDPEGYAIQIANDLGMIPKEYKSKVSKALNGDQEARAEMMQFIDGDAKIDVADPDVRNKLMRSIAKREGPTKRFNMDEIDYVTGKKEMPEGYQSKDLRKESKDQPGGRRPEPHDLSNAPGLLVKGNIDPYNRKVEHRPDGSIATVASFSFNEDGKEVLIPSVIDGKTVSQEEAIAHYHRTGEHLGKFDTPEHADDYAQKFHENQEAIYGGNAESGQPRTETQLVLDSYVEKAKKVQEAKLEKERKEVLAEAKDAEYLALNKGDPSNLRSIEERLRSLGMFDDANNVRQLREGIASNQTAYKQAMSLPLPEAQKAFLDAQALLSDWKKSDGTTMTVDEHKLYAKGVETMGRVISARAEAYKKDPALAAMQDAAFAPVPDENGNITNETIVATALEVQRKNGVRTPNAIPKDQADRLGEAWLQTPAPKAFLDQLKSEYGNQYQEVVGQLVREKKVPPTVGIIDDMEPAAGSLLAKTGEKDWLKNTETLLGMADADKKSMKERVRKEMDPITHTFAMQGDLMSPGDLYDAVYKLALQYKTQGMGESDAVKTAAAKVYLDQWKPMGSWRLPAQLDSGAVEQGTIYAKEMLAGNVKDIYLGVPQSGVSGKRWEQILKQNVLYKSQWVNTADGKGLMLVMANTPVRKNDGTPIIYSFEELQNMGKKNPMETQTGDPSGAMSMASGGE